jgi:hypothetical protein
VKNWLEPDETTRPGVFDIDTRAVDPESVPNWVNVRRRFLNTHEAPRALLDITPSNAMTNHPSSRYLVKGVDMLNIGGFEHLPMWMQERIAVLNMAPEGVVIPDVGKRWADSPHKMRFLADRGEDNKRFYTLLWWPRPDGTTVTWHQGSTR